MQAPTNHDVVRREDMTESYAVKVQDEGEHGSWNKLPRYTLSRETGGPACARHEPPRTATARAAAPAMPHAHGLNGDSGACPGRAPKKRSTLVWDAAKSTLALSLRHRTPCV